ncbi:kiaa0195 [Nesidiocoris tenuis]|uniref:Kiaa0195 n=1 Tax=Nesidiocoris tenuis TaxID=355587 RepID=A0ABN7B570_9HEMI|nr:kiaa0195 [Nesidiocoris tenuis]
MDRPKESVDAGLTTYEALGVLKTEISQLLSEQEPARKIWLAALWEILSVGNELSTFNWISLGCLLYSGFAIIVTSIVVEAETHKPFIGYGVLIIIMAIINTGLVCWDHVLRKSEISERIKVLLQDVEECREKCSWGPDNYPHLCSPYSPCITLQWTYRDGQLVNLPWALLCKGDTIVLRPGQPAPGSCMQENNPNLILSCGEVYSPPQKHDHISTPTARVPFNNKRYVLLETPILRYFREVLETTRHINASSYDKNRHLIMHSCVQSFLLPLLFLVTLMSSILRYIYVDHWVKAGHWSVMFVLMPVLVTLPVLPLVFTPSWLILHAFGNAKLSAFLQSNSLSQIQLESAHSADPFEDISIVDEEVEAIGSGIKWGQHFVHSLLGQQHFLALTRSSNPLHVLGSVTALSCVDKKGILSWPNPTAEKIFFLKTTSAKPTISRNPTMEKNVDIMTDNVEMDTIEVPTATSRKCSRAQELYTQVEVLDLTHDLSCPFKLEFDDSHWQDHLSSLKPIGLAILLNTCNMATQEHYVQFCSHVTAEALYNEDLVPVTNRRCLCELSNQIGFTDRAKSNFSLKQQLSTFRHVQPETVRRDIKFARSLALATKLKLPFPHMVAVVISDNTTPGSLQLFSQATGDIALDSCIDFWDGNTLRVLSPSDRKKILDFYQRTSLTAYCTAFAYRPLGKSVNPSLSGIYMELPSESHNLYLRNRSPTPLDWDLHRSEDSLFGSETLDGEISDIEGCFETQCNQIFLGMVTMQYQAQIEMVQLIEQLERACIRFVHFSKENELRSRVFSEKMGLESGWNCHISLLSSETPEDDGPVEEELVLDDDDAQHQTTTPLLGNNLWLTPKKDGTPVDATSQDWQSLSCLTDSTEQSAPINFDMSNRAKLPRGIEQIRPHLEKVDNVPLLVSLFTDCTPSTTLEMIEIMQDYGEIVCVMGSSANADNSSIFLKANTSVSVEPLYPQVCQKVPVFTPCPDGIAPVHLSHRLNSLPCSVSMTRQRPISFFHLIMHARHFMQCLWTCVQFWMSGVTAVSLVQLITTIVLLPPIFTVGHVLWICCLVIPVISLTLGHAPLNPQVMQMPGNKVQCSLSFEVAAFVLWCYGSRFLPTLLIVPMVYGATLHNLATTVTPVVKLANLTTNESQYTIMVYPKPNDPWGGWERHQLLMGNAQILAVTLLVVHLLCISCGFVHREHLSWRRSPLKNRKWASACFFFLLCQTGYVLVNFSDIDVPWIAFGLAIASIFIVAIVNELVKWQEIKANMRYEKRARLDFGTKLGMNSPF